MSMHIWNEKIEYRDFVTATGHLKYHDVSLAFCGAWPGNGYLISKLEYKYHLLDKTGICDSCLLMYFAECAEEVDNGIPA